MSKRKNSAWLLSREDAPEAALAGVDPGFASLENNAAYRIAVYLRRRREPSIFAQVFGAVAFVAVISFWGVGSRPTDFAFMMLALGFGSQFTPFGPQHLPTELLMDLRISGFETDDFARGLLASTLIRKERRGRLLSMTGIAILALCGMQIGAWLADHGAPGASPLWVGQLEQASTALLWGAAALCGFYLGYPFGDLPGMAAALRSETLGLKPLAGPPQRRLMNLWRRGQSPFPTTMGVVLLVALAGSAMQGLLSLEPSGRTWLVPLIAGAFALVAGLGGRLLARSAPAHYAAYMKEFRAWANEAPGSRWDEELLTKWSRATTKSGA